jgi:endonuclease YncB( thermonuclease family)
MKLFIFAILISLNTLSNIGNLSLNSEHSLYIMDGDSVSLQMCIIGIDTPEIQQICQKCASKVIDCGQLSKSYLQKLLKSISGKIVIQRNGVDHYERILMHIFKGDSNIDKLMVESGMAFSYKETYRLEENLAKSEKLGF